MLIAATILLLLVSYRFAFKNTFDAWQTNTQLKEQLLQTTDIALQPGYLERKNRNMEKVFERYKADTLTFRNNVINTASLLAEKANVRLVDVPVQNMDHTAGRSVIQQLNFEGDFFALTTLAKQLEQQTGVGVVRSLYWKRMDVRFNSHESKKLILEVFLQTSK